MQDYKEQDTYLRTSLSPQFFSSQNSLFNIWPGSILQLQECEYSKLKEDYPTVSSYTYLRIGLDHTLPRPTKPLLHIGLQYRERRGDRFAVKPGSIVWGRWRSPELNC